MLSCNKISGDVGWCLYNYFNYFVGYFKYVVGVVVLFSWLVGYSEFGKVVFVWGK